MNPTHPTTPDETMIISSDKDTRSPTSPRTFIAPLPGFEWNPLLTLPRNRLCPCLSAKKFKLCCLPRLPKVVTKEHAEQFKAQMKRKDLVFLTNENKNKIEEWISTENESKSLSDPSSDEAR